MKTWLARHEAINTFSEYLRWSIPGYDTKADSLDEGLVPNEDNNPSNNELPTPPITAGQFNEVSYSVAVRPPLPKTSINAIINEFRAPNFLPCLYSFLQQRGIVPENFNSIDPATITFPVFK